MYTIDLSGVWQCAIPGMNAHISIPGTLDLNGIGYPDVGGKKWHPDTDTNAALYQVDQGIQTRLTRVCTYEGPAVITRTIDWELPEGKRLFIDVERSRHLTLRVNGQEAAACSERSVSTPYTFEVTGMMTGHDEIAFTADNSYPGWPHDAIVFSSAATDETQTNWNGLLGYVRLRVESASFIEAVRVYPKGNVLDVCVVLNAGEPVSDIIHLRSDTLAEDAAMPVSVQPGVHEIWFRGLGLDRDVRRWDEEDGILYALTANLGCESHTVQFGVRDFRAEGGYLTLNGRRIFLRSEANCCVFPETGHAPMTVEEWKHVLTTYRSYGVNCMRFHSHTPPEAAFTAADEMGMLMQPELGHWNPETAFETDESIAYYTGELRGTLRALANHPSFVMLTFGNELAAHELGHRRMEELLTLAHVMDETRLFACASNAHYGWYGHQGASDFYTSTNLREHELRATYAGMGGYLNHSYPSAAHHYDGAMKKLRRETGKPVVSFEVGQFEVLPDFGEIDEFRGATRAVNLEIIRDKVIASGMEDMWQRQVEATGEMSNLCYREEIEAALRTESFSGISLLGIQDFPGQGTALVGMLNSHLKPKPYAFAQPERFHAFFRSVLPLALLPKYTYEAGETLSAPARIANYGRTALAGEAEWVLEGEGFRRCGRLPYAEAKPGALTSLGVIEADLTGVAKAVRLTLTLCFADAVNQWPVWVYPVCNPACPDNVHECRQLDDAALNILHEGGVVYLSPDSTKEAIPSSIQAQFSPDFWSVGTFPYQEGGMGQLIDAGQEIFRHFPTEGWSSWQWWPMANRRAMILPRRMKAIVTEMDSYAYLRPMAKLLCCRCHGGTLLISSMGLHELQQYPEARALQHAIYEWLATMPEAPDQDLTPDEVRAIIC